MNTAREVAGLLAGYRFTFTTEAELQEGIRSVLRGEGVKFLQEARVGHGNRIDFLVAGGIGVEVKVDGSPFEVAEQLARYLRTPDVAEVVLVTTRRAHEVMPQHLVGKPVVVHVLAGGVA